MGGSVLLRHAINPSHLLSTSRDLVGAARAQTNQKPPFQFDMTRTKTSAKAKDVPERATKDMNPPRALVARMQTTSSAASKAGRSRSFSALAMQRALYTKTEKLHWTLHDKRNIPQCRDCFNCATCSSYFKHLNRAAFNNGRRSYKGKPTAVASESILDDDDNSGAEYSGTENDDEFGGYESPTGSEMRSLFRLQDLRGKLRAMDWEDSDEERNQDAGGHAAVSIMLAETEQKKEEVLVQNTALQVRLETIEGEASNAYTEIRLHLDRACMVANDAKSDLVGTRVERDQARMDRDEARAELNGARTELAAAREEIARLSQQLANMDSARPRKKPATSAAHSNSASYRGISPHPDRSVEERPRDSLHTMPRPGPTEDPFLIAQYLQHHEETGFKGIPLSRPSWVVDMRDVRGYRQVMSRVLPKTKNEAKNVSFHRACCLVRVLGVLAVPGRYQSLLQEAQIPISSTDSLTPCDFGPDPLMHADSHVAGLLAKHGMTVQIADDSWQFCHRYLCAETIKPDGYMVPQFAALWERVKPIQPPGLNSPARDLYPRTVPGKSKPNLTMKWYNSLYPLYIVLTCVFDRHH